MLIPMVEPVVNTISSSCSRAEEALHLPRTASYFSVATLER